MNHKHKTTISKDPQPFCSSYFVHPLYISLQCTHSLHCVCWFMLDNTHWPLLCFMLVCTPLHFLDQFISNKPCSLDGCKPESKEIHHKPEQELDNYLSPKIRSCRSPHARRQQLHCFQCRKLLSCFSWKHKKVHLFPPQNLCYLWRVIGMEMGAEYAGKTRVKVTVWNNLWGFSAHKQNVVCHQDEFRWHLCQNGSK